MPIAGARATSDMHLQYILAAVPGVVLIFIALDRSARSTESLTPELAGRRYVSDEYVVYAHESPEKR